MSLDMSDTEQENTATEATALSVEQEKISEDKKETQGEEIELSDMSKQLRYAY